MMTDCSWPILLKKSEFQARRCRGCPLTSEPIHHVAWLFEQLVRDVRIAQIYEGTNGVQAMDLLGRKVIADGGMQIGLLIDEIIDYSETPGLVYARELRQAGLLLKRDVRWILDRAERDRTGMSPGQYRESSKPAG